MKNLKTKINSNVPSTLPSNLNQRLIDGYRVKLFAKVKDCLDRKKQHIKKHSLEFKEYLRNKNLLSINYKATNNSFYHPIVGA